MIYKVTFEHIGNQFPAYTLGIEADNYNEALRLAKQARGKDEEITAIVLDASSVFTDLLKGIRTGFTTKTF